MSTTNISIVVLSKTTKTSTDMKVVEKIHKEVVRLETRDLFKNIHSLIPGPLN